MGIVTIVVTCTDYFDVCLGNGRLLGKFLADKVLGNSEVAVKEPADQTYGEHVAAFQHGFVVHARVGQAILYHLRDGSSDDVVLNTHLFDGIISCELRFL